MDIVFRNYRKRGIDMSLFRVAIHYGINSNGFLSYDTEAKTVSGRFQDGMHQEVCLKVRYYNSGWI